MGKNQVDVNRSVHLFLDFKMNIFTYQLVHQINRKVNNFSRLRTILYVTLENFVVHTLKKTQNKFVELRQVAVYSMGVVGALLLKVRLS